MDRPVIALFLDSSQLGGIETHIFHLANGLTQAGYAAKVLFFKRYGQPHPLETLLNQYEISFEYLDGKLVSIYQWLKQHNSLLLHTHGYKAGVIGRVTGWLTKVPVVSTFHNGDQGSRLVRIYTWLDQLTSRLSTNIAVSLEIAERLPGSVTLMNNFIDVPKQHLAPGQEVAFVGRLSHEKGPDLFIQLAKHQPNLRFRVYGSGSMLSCFKSSPPTNVKLIGQVSSMEPFWSDIGLLCITSRQEGLPLVALEAMAHGIPVLAFRLGALPDLIQPDINGWIIPEGNLKEMSQKLDYWSQLTAAEKNTIAKSCVQTISNNYSYEAVIPELLTLYQFAVTAKGKVWQQPSRHQQYAHTDPACQHS